LPVAPPISRTVTCKPDTYRERSGDRIILRDNAPFLKDKPPPGKHLLVSARLGRFNMSQNTAVEMISRRRLLGMLGAGVAFGMGAPAAVLTASDAEAQTPGVEQRQDRPDDGTERRQDRRTDRTEERQERRSGRTRRRMARRKARRERAMARHEGRKRRRMARRSGTGTSTKGTGAPSTGTTGTGTPGTGATGTGTTGQGPARQ
jgi:hypothetical protein